MVKWTWQRLMAGSQVLSVGVVAGERVRLCEGRMEQGGIVAS